MTDNGIDLIWSKLELKFLLFTFQFCYELVVSTGNGIKETVRFILKLKMLDCCWERNKKKKNCCHFQEISISSGVPSGIGWKSKWNSMSWRYLANYPEFWLNIVLTLFHEYCYEAGKKLSLSACSNLILNMLLSTLFNEIHGFCEVFWNMEKVLYWILLCFFL